MFQDIANTLTKWVVKGAWEGTKLTAKAISSANAQSKSKELNTSEFMELLDRAQKGNADAQCNLALYYAEKQDFETATYWLTKSAEQGNEHAIEILDHLQSD